eukprot:Lankesteria_metandrocarpae@DN8323_c0_g1_i1.p1
MILYCYFVLFALAGIPIVKAPALRPQDTRGISYVYYGKRNDEALGSIYEVRSNGTQLSAEAPLTRSRSAVRYDKRNDKVNRRFSKDGTKLRVTAPRTRSRTATRSSSAGIELLENSNNDFSFLGKVAKGQIAISNKHAIPDSMTEIPMWKNHVGVEVSPANESFVSEIQKVLTLRHLKKDLIVADFTTGRFVSINFITHFSLEDGKLLFYHQVEPNEIRSIIDPFGDRMFVKVCWDVGAVLPQRHLQDPRLAVNHGGTIKIPELSFVGRFCIIPLTNPIHRISSGVQNINGFRLELAESSVRNKASGIHNNGKVKLRDRSIRKKPPSTKQEHL